MFVFWRTRQNKDDRFVIICRFNVILIKITTSFLKTYRQAKKLHGKAMN